MKRLVSILILFLIPFISNAQSQDWKQLGSSLKTAPNVRIQTKSGYLFGSMSGTAKFVFAKNNGSIWHELPSSIFYGFNWDLVRENKIGELYYAGSHGLYFFNPLTLESQLIVSIPGIRDFAFLTSGNIIIVTTSKIVLLTPGGSVINEHHWLTDYVNLLMDPTGDKHYVVQKSDGNTDLIEFNGNLTEIKDKVPVNTSSPILRNGNRLFTLKTYSDNGIDWKNLNLPNEIFSRNNIGSDGTLFYSTQYKLFISTDNGMTFVEKPFPVTNMEYISSDGQGVLIVTENRSQPLLYRSYDQGSSWELIHANVGIPHLSFIQGGIAAGLNENIYFSAGHNKFSYKKDSLSPWQRKSDNQQGLDLFSPASLANGTTIAFSNSGQVFIAKDNGDYWEVHSEDRKFFGNYQGLIQKADAEYIWYKDTMNYSKDFGKSWEFISITDPEILPSQNAKLIAANFGIYFYKSTQQVGHKELIYYNSLSGEKVKNILPPPSIVFATSYYNSNFYYLSRLSGVFQLKISEDFGTTFTSNPIPGFNESQNYYIKTDHLDNIYVYSNRQIFYTEDQGNSWHNISPEFPEFERIEGLGISYDNYIYLATMGMGLLKYRPQLKQPRKLVVTVLDDQNKNCSIDLNEPVIKSVKVLVNGNYLQHPGPSGEATFNIHTTLNDVQVIYNPDLFLDCESSYTIEFEDTDTELHLDIPLKVLKYCADPVVGLSVPFLRRCFDNTYSGSVCNEGNIESINTEIEITLDPFFDFISASLPIKSINGQTLVLDAGHLQPGDCQSFHFTVNVNCTAELGQEHCISAFSSAGSTDCGAASTRDAYMDCQENIGAYDPNDKNIFVNGNRNQTYIEPGDKIEYLIRFQNTGTDTAFTVRIEDPITRKFNVSSLKPIAASHEYSWSVNNSMLVVLFENIQLVDSFKNEPASHGFIKFEIQLDSLTLRGDDVKNLAGIFFDFNEPIITEEVITVIGQPLSTKELSFESITAFPNPANGLVYISGNALSDKPQDLMIYDIHGKLVLSQKISHFNNSIDISKYAPGTYILMMKSGNQVYRGMLVKM